MMPYSLAVRCSGLSATATVWASRLTLSLPVWIVEFRMALRAAHDRLEAGDQFAAVERLGQEVVGAETEALDLVIKLDEARQDQDRGAHARGAQPAQHLVPVHIREEQIEDDDVVIVELADLEPVLAQIGGVADKAFALQHQLDACRCRGIVLNQQNTHYKISRAA